MNASSVRLGLTGTVITADLRTIVNSIGQRRGLRQLGRDVGLE